MPRVARCGWSVGLKETCVVIGLALASSFAIAAADGSGPPGVAGYTGDEWRQLSKGKVMSRLVSSKGSLPVSEASGAFIVNVPWRHAFDQLGRIEEMPKYSSCLKAMEILIRTSRAGRTQVKARETHKTLWITARYTVDYQEDAERREIRWQLDPTAQNDVARMTGSWNFTPVDAKRTLVTYRLTASSGRALPRAIEDFFAARMLPGFLKDVRTQVEQGAFNP